MPSPLHHKRKRSKPNKTQHHKILDILVYFAAFFGIIMTLPQVANIWIVSLQIKKRGFPAFFAIFLAFSLLPLLLLEHMV